MDTAIKMGFVYRSGQIVGVEQFCTYFTCVAVYVVYVGIMFLLASGGGGGFQPRRNVYF